MAAEWTTFEGGMTALHFAARQGYTDVAAALLDAGVDVNGRDSLDQTPLIAAVSQNSQIAVQEVLKRGAALDISDKAGWSPLHYAATGPEPRLVQLLIERGADVNARDSIQDSPFLYAGAEGRLEILRLTLAAGADSVNSTAGAAHDATMSAATIRSGQEVLSHAASA